MQTPDEMAENLGIELFDYQREYLIELSQLDSKSRTCLYYKTGAGKTLTALLGLAMHGWTDALVIAPPATHVQWQKAGGLLGIFVNVMSHAKFRMRSTKIIRNQPIIADEFHLFGGQQGQGWRKMEATARGLNAPLVMLSATPNYNDAERVYCVQKILSPHTTKGGFLQFLYENCHTMQNPFSQTPKVTGFKDYPDARSFLADLPRVFHVPDLADFELVDVPYRVDLPDEMIRFGLDVRGEPHLFSSQIERTHVERVYGLVDEGRIRPEIMRLLLPMLDQKVLVFSNHATVAVALAASLAELEMPHLLVTGALSRAAKTGRIEEFLKPGGPDILVGTASLATGTDGLDKVCHRLVILDDTDDNALRRQLIGRILPRGGEEFTHSKEFFVMVPDL